MEALAAVKQGDSLIVWKLLMPKHLERPRQLCMPQTIATPLARIEELEEIRRRADLQSAEYTLAMSKLTTERDRMKEANEKQWLEDKVMNRFNSACNHNTVYHLSPIAST